MNFLQLLTQYSANKVFVSIVLGAIAGCMYSAMIPIIMNGVADIDSGQLFENDSDTLFGYVIANSNMAILYFSICFLILFTRSASQIISMRLGSDVSKDLRSKLYKKINISSIRTIENVGEQRVFSTINLDIPRIVMGARIVPFIFINVITIVGMLAFLLYINIDIFQLVILSIILGVVVYQLPISFGRSVFSKSRDTNDKAMESVKGLIYGAKELRLNSDKMNYFNKNIVEKYEDKLVKYEKLGFTITEFTICLGDLLSFVIIGIVCFVVVNYISVDAAEIVGVLMALLYITGPISAILNSIPTLSISSISLRKFNVINELLQDKSDINSESSKEMDSWQSIFLRNVFYAYDCKSNFSIGPIDMEINRGEIVFIVGGNGSGKSTLSKILTLHYVPSKGSLFFDDISSTDNLQECRNQISAIYSNFHLFNELLCHHTLELDAKVHFYLNLLKLDGKLEIVDGKFSTLALSDGQRKRVALLVSLLEEKSFYVFDEFAADQDPDFREFFYRELLPILKNMNKAIVVISHDERYFDAADHVYVMNYGTISKISPV